MESAERRVIDHLLIETIKRVGVSNFSLIARLTGLNPETVRYKVNKQLSRMALSVDVNIDYGRLGFTRGLLRVKGVQTDGASWLNHARYLTFSSKTMGTNNFTCIYAIPPKLKKKYNNLLNSMKHSGMIEDFETSEIFWIRYPPFRSEYYDFDEKRWIVDWQRVDATFHETGVTSSPPVDGIKLDLFDLKILKRIQKDPTISVTKIAKEMNVNPRTARYHYLEHILKNKFVLSFDVRWMKDKINKSGELMQIIYSTTNLTEEQKGLTCKVFNRIPFTWLEASTEHGYLAILDIPIMDFHETIRYIERNTETIRDKLEMTMLDPSNTQLFSVPDKMFDKKKGWRLTNSLDGESNQSNRST